MPAFKSWMSFVFLAAVTSILSGESYGQSAGRDFPTRPITLIVPYAPGNTDIIARIYLTQISQNADWAFTYDYKPGAAGTIGAAMAAKAPADGYTLLMMSSTLTIGHLQKRKLPYDWKKDFTPVYQMTKTPGILLVNPSLPVKSFAEYMAYAKANPGKINYGTVGTGGIVHLISAWMHNLMGAEVTFVPYKGYGPISAALVGGEVQAAHPTYKAFHSYITAGKLRALAITSANGRIKQLPGVKSIAEEGLPEFDYSVWMGMFLPSGTPAVVVNRMNVEFARAAKSPEVIRKFDDLGEGFNLGPSLPDDFRQIVNATGDRLTRIVKETGIELEE